MIKVSSVSRPTAQYGWRWSITVEAVNQCLQVETAIDGSKLYLVEMQSEKNADRALLDDSFFLPPSAQLFDAISALETRFNKQDHERLLLANAVQC